MLAELRESVVAGGQRAEVPEVEKSLRKPDQLVVIQVEPKRIYHMQRRRYKVLV